MAKKDINKAFIIRAIIYILIALIIILAVNFDIPKGLKSIVVGNQNIPKNFGQTDALDIAMIDVGQSECTIIGSQGQFVLVDSGDHDKGYAVLRQLDRLKVKSIDMMILTHPHADHIGGADDIMHEMTVGMTVMPDNVNSTQDFESVLGAIEDNDITINIPDVGDVLVFAGFEIIFLHPPQDAVFENDNDGSIIFKVVSRYGSAVFTGDGEYAAENAVLNYGIDIIADILKVGHHGSDTSTSEAFLSAINPSYATISCGKNNDFGHPHEDILARLARHNVSTYITYESGTIYFSLDATGITVVTENGD